jgi:hypothetical protein
MLSIVLIVGFSILLRVYSQSEIKPPYATQYSVFTLYYINLQNMFRPLMVANFIYTIYTIYIQFYI